MRGTVTGAGADDGGTIVVDPERVAGDSSTPGRSAPAAGRDGRPDPGVGVGPGVRSPAGADPLVGVTTVDPMVGDAGAGPAGEGAAGEGTAAPVEACSASPSPAMMPRTAVTEAPAATILAAAAAEDGGVVEVASRRRRSCASRSSTSAEPGTGSVVIPLLVPIFPVVLPLVAVVTVVIVVLVPVVPIVVVLLAPGPAPRGGRRRCGRGGRSAR